MKLNKKILMSVLAAVLLLTVIVSGTLAYFTDKDESANTFTLGKVDITIDETTGEEYTMIPGVTVAKDPVVTVKKGSEDCWVFVKLTESENFEDYLTYEVDSNNWTELEDDVYYCEAKAVTADRAITVLRNNQVAVKHTVTKEMMDALMQDPTKQPTLTFDAYAIQMEGIADAATAWANLNPTNP